MPEKLDGSVEAKDHESNNDSAVDDARADLTLGGKGSEGSLILRNSDDGESVRLDVSRSRAGRLSMRDSLGKSTVRLDGETGMARVEGLVGHLSIGGHGEDGGLSINTGKDESTCRVDAANASVVLGGHGHYGSLFLNNRRGEKTVALYGHAGELILFSGRREESIRLNGKTGNLHLGGNGQDGDIFLKNKAGENTIHLDGEVGVIHIPNGDCAEDFQVADGARLAAGDVVVFDEDEALWRCDEAYDKRVAGVISGAGDMRPGIVLGRDRRHSRRLPVALIGKVHCKVDAQFGAIELGDLLTTSPRPGHAMKAADPERAFGAVLGKALRPLAGGDGLIPVLVALR